jgi:hypothetical protein
MIFYYPYNYDTHAYETKDASGNDIQQQWTPYVGKWTYVLKKGSYAKDYLATLLTKQMAKVQPNTYEARFEPNIGGADDNFPLGERGGAIDGFALRPSFIINPTVIYEADTMSMYVNFGRNEIEPSPYDGFIPGNNAYLVPACYISINNAVSSGARRNPDNMSSQNPTFESYSMCPTYTMTGLTNTFATQSFLSPLTGATQISLLWNNQNNGIYSFDYIHTPILIKGLEVVVASSAAFGLPLEPGGPENLNPTSISMSDRQSGIIFANMTPITFWKDTLGFDVPNITYRFQNTLGTNQIVPQIKWTNYLAITTSNYWGCAMISDPRTTSNISGQTYQFQVSFRDTLYRKWAAQGYTGMISWQANSTNTLDAITAPVNINDTGHFLIEITGYNNNYYDEKNAYQIKAIVSSYYITANSFATAPFPDSYVYQHHGEPLVIGSLRIRILNPKTKKPVDLGANSTVYLQVTQNITPAKVQQPED